jgi:hypothetical protein
MPEIKGRRVHWKSEETDVDCLSTAADAGTCHGSVQSGTEEDDVDRNWRPNLTSLLQPQASAFCGMNLVNQALTLIKADLATRK